MARIDVEKAGGKNVIAFLDMIAYSELGYDLLHDPRTDDGYRVIVGSTPKSPILFDDYSQHPRISEWIDFNHDGKEDPGERSDAAGRYQILGRYAPAYARQLALPDFGPVSQDRIALQLIHECHATALIQNGRFQEAIAACRSRWASLPGANYPGQHMNSMGDLQMAFLSAGGSLA